MSGINFNPELEAIVIDPDYKNRKGYNEDFIGVTVPLPEISEKHQKYICKLKGSNEQVLKYHHYSIVMHAKRKMPFFTAVNIDGVKYNKLKDDIPSRKAIGKDKWFTDPRINDEDQISKVFYKNNDFDLGHLVRREDCLWGNSVEEALKANNDSFHLPNASPQHKDFNQNGERWKGLEDYILKNARNEEHLLKVNVFSGPIFSPKDFEFTFNDITVRVPNKFWKVLSINKGKGEISSTGYILSQKDLTEDMERESFTYGAFLTYQTTIGYIEEQTGLLFNLSKYDPMLKKKAAFENEGFTVDRPRLISANNDIIL